MVTEETLARRRELCALEAEAVRLSNRRDELAHALTMGRGDAEAHLAEVAAIDAALSQLRARAAEVAS
jgi:alpha-D-ribose 1-methylphosphonate 5-triphosphate synthase subunit PhnG